MIDTIETLLTDRAGAMASHDGVPVAVVHIHGAANWLQAALLSARDRLIHAPAPRTDAEVKAPAEAAPDEPVVKAEKADKAAPDHAPEKAAPKPVETASDEPVAEAPVEAAEDPAQ